MDIDETLVTILESAAGKAFKALQEEHMEEQFYYFAMLNDGNWRPYISAWSREALECFYEENEVEDGEKGWYRWSGVESPYMAYGWDEYFAEYEDFLFETEQKHCEADDDTADAMWKTLLNSMEEAMRRLDQKGIFGTGAARDQVVIAVELVPPARSNYTRTERLNKSGLIREFLDENADLLEEDAEE